MARGKKVTDDDVKHVEFLYMGLKDFRDVQDKHYKDLITKSNFLCGFIVTILTLYGALATQVNSALRVATLLMFGVALLVLSGALANRKFYQAEMSDIDVDALNYFDKVYQAVANIKRACDDNEKPLKSVASHIRWGVRIFVVGLILLVFSFLVSGGDMVKSKQHDRYHFHQTTRPSKR